MTETWDLSLIYPSDNQWEKDFNAYQTKLSEGKEKCLQLSVETDLGKILEIFFELSRELEKLYTYVHLKFDEDLSNNFYKEMYGKVIFLSTEFEKGFCFIEPKILELENEKFQALLNDPDLEKYKFYIERIYSLKNHTLSEDKEKLVALAGPSLDGSAKAFSAFNNADLKFEEVEDESKNKKPLTQALYLSYLRDKDRTLRKNAFEKIHEGYFNHENLLCELLFANVNKHQFSANARGYDSCLQAALFPNNIDLQVYHHLIKATKENGKALHDYVSLRKEIMGLDKLFPYDLYVPLIEDCQIEMSYEKACDTILESVAPLGKEYQEALTKGLKVRKWVDPYEKQGKRSGAYSSGCYDTEPYILMNYHGNINDIFTLAHEAGHSMHSYLSNHSQPYQYSRYPIFLAEIASTFNELLLLKQLKKEYADNEDVQKYLLMHQIDSFRATFFRQTQFAEFELLIHEKVENNEPLTPKFLNEEYQKLNQEYYGKDLETHILTASEWARIPHFYYNFYVYQYATGISVAYYFLDQIEKDPSKVEDYLNFLQSGSKDYPQNILQKCGVDLVNGGVIESALDRFQKLVIDLKSKFEQKKQLN